MPTQTKTKTKRAAAIEAIVTVAKFTDMRRPFSLIREQTPLHAFPKVSPGVDADYMPCGWDTPLRDSTAKFIHHLDSLQAEGRVVIGLMADESGSMGGREYGVAAGINEFVEGMAEVKKVDPKSSGKVLAVIITDGGENSSREVGSEALAGLIAAREANGWTFIYMGANQDATSVGTAMGYSGSASGQTVSLRSNSSRAFHSALASTGRNHGAAYLGDNASYMMATADSASRVIDEDGEEEAAPSSSIKMPPTPKPVKPREYATSTKDAVKSAKDLLS